MIPANNIINKNSFGQKITDWLITSFFILLAVFCIVTLIFWTIIPYFQMKIYIDNINLSLNQIDQIQKKNLVFSPYTQVQSFIRKDLLTNLIRMEISQGDMYILDEAIIKMEESVSTDDSNLNNYILLALAYIKKAEILDDPDFLKVAERYYNKSIELSPKQQKLLLAYGTFLFDQNRKDEAFKILKNTLDLNPSAPFPNFYYGLAETTLGYASYIDALDHLEAFFESDFQSVTFDDSLNPDRGWVKTIAIYRNFLIYFYNNKDRKHLLIVLERLSILDEKDGELFRQITDYISNTGQIPFINFEK